MTPLKHHVMLADHYESLANAAEDYATFELYHSLAVHHLAEAHKHDADGVLSERPIAELRKIIEHSSR
ncbi:MAG: hypothetical protein JO128_09445 [Alphaproteobacteria bacterium]|nr:hypothetical protein [Alphaproteobacteria bacterium]